MTLIEPDKLSTGESDILLFREEEDGQMVDFVLARSMLTILQAKQLRHDVYLQCGFIEKPFPDCVIPDRQDNRQAHYVVAKSSGIVIGVMRLGASPFKTFDVLGKAVFPNAVPLIRQVNISSSYELGSLAVRMNSGKRHISGALYKAAYIIGEIINVDYWVIDVDTRVLEALKRLGWNIIEVGPRHLYMGSMTVPGVMPAKDQASHLRPDYLDYIHSGS